ncbi:MAG: hypothetical protein M0Q26_02310 [Chitinophagaceae bacterium]|nr:hypothetical protein [Chitinophagaceae bacterium]MDP1764868.1 hypothetical protein [Sediminibacterium sp.]MDP1810942.1 hypothetical protein [Sediminibacterium sp.]MDP3128353.1 hypothetical protein [Sediminibacterium sp.]MDP3666290.1 hypothetical protein [Sediminibacterium sp.]
MRFNIKNSTIPLVMLWIPALSFSQPIKSEKIEDTHIVSLLNNVREYRQFKSAGLIAGLFVISNPSGSALIPEGDEVTDNIYIAVSEYDEQPKQSLFCLKNVYAVSKIQLEKAVKNTISISFSYIENKVKKKSTIKVTIDDIVID